MYARVWKFYVLPEKIEEFAAACRAVGTVNRARREFRGFVVVRGGTLDSPECTVVSVWDSLEALRASESGAFQKGIVRVLDCCTSGAALQEEDVLICEFGPIRKSKGASAERRPKPNPRKKDACQPPRFLR